MKILLSLLVASAIWLACVSQATAAPATNDLASMADIFYVPTNRVEWVCSQNILGTTNDVVYVVKNVQTNRCGVFVVSYPAQSPSKAPVIMEWVNDPRPVSFRLKIRQTPMLPNSPATFPGLRVVEHVEVTLGPLSFEDGRRETYFAYVDIGGIFYTSETDVMFGRISESTLLHRIGKKP